MARNDHLTVTQCLTKLPKYIIKCSQPTDS